MYTYKSSAELKSLAKGSLLGNYGAAIAVFLIYGIISWILSMILVFVTDTTSIAGFIMYYILMFIVTLFTSVIMLGNFYFYMNLTSGRPYKISDAFYGFTYHPDKMILISAIRFLLSLLCMLPFIGCALLFLSIGDTALILAMTITCIIGYIGVVYITLCYSQAHYLLLEFPTYSVKELLKASRDLMKGHKGRLFYIMVSFLPLMILAVISCGIGLLWLMPYMQAVYVYFYFDLIQGRQAAQPQEHINVAI